MWKLIDGYRYQYRVNDQGEVQKLQDSGKWKTLRPWSYRGQMRVHFRKNDGGIDRPSVSGLVAEYFMGGTPNGMIRVHKNGMKSDNARENILFCKRGKQNKGVRPANSRPVFKVDIYGNVVAIYKNGVEAAKKNHISQSAINKRCLGKIKDPYRLDGYNYIFEPKETKWM